MSKIKTVTAQEWLSLCQMAIAEKIPFNQIPFPAFLASLRDCLPCQMQIGGNLPITVVEIGSIHPLNYSLSYRGAIATDIDGGVLGGGIALDAARIINVE